MAFRMSWMPSQKCSKTLYGGAIVTQFDLATAIAEPLKAPGPNGEKSDTQCRRAADQKDQGGARPR